MHADSYTEEAIAAKTEIASSDDNDNDVNSLLSHKSVNIIITLVKPSLPPHLRHNSNRLWTFLEEKIHKVTAVNN